MTPVPGTAEATASARRLIGVEGREDDFDELSDQLPVLCLLRQVRRFQNLLNGKETGRILGRGTGQFGWSKSWAECCDAKGRS